MKLNLCKVNTIIVEIYAVGVQLVEIMELLFLSKSLIPSVLSFLLSLWRISISSACSFFTVSIFFSSFLRVPKTVTSSKSLSSSSVSSQNCSSLILCSFSFSMDFSHPSSLRISYTSSIGVPILFFFSSSVSSSSFLNSGMSLKS